LKILSQYQFIVTYFKATEFLWVQSAHSSSTLKAVPYQKYSEYPAIFLQFGHVFVVFYSVITQPCCKYL